MKFLKKLSIIIVSYNTVNLTVKCISSIYSEMITSNFELIVVDNASTDGSAAAIRNQFPQCQLIKLEKNIGFGPANNCGARHASGRYLLLLNPDTLILDHAIDKLISFAETHPSAKIWGGRTKFPDGSLNPSSCWHDMTLWTLFCQALGLSRMLQDSPFFNMEAYGNWPRNSVRHVDIISGCFLMIDHQLWNELGGFDETFFMYAEEADLCFRARKAGADPIVSPKPEIIHYGGASESVRADKVIRLFAGKMTLVKKHWSHWRIFLAQALFQLMVLIRIGGFRIARMARNKPSDEVQLTEWAYIWRFRDRWICGYRKPSH